MVITQVTSASTATPPQTTSSARPPSTATPYLAGSALCGRRRRKILCAARPCAIAVSQPSANSRGPQRVLALCVRLVRRGLSVCDEQQRVTLMKLGDQLVGVRGIERDWLQQSSEGATIDST